MANHGKFFSISITAGADLSTGDGTGAQYKGIAATGLIAASGNTAMGLLQNKPKSGEDAEVGYFGHMKGVAGAAIAAGARMIMTTSGYAITAVGAVIPVGKAITAAASGATVEGIWDFTATGVSSGP